MPTLDPTAPCPCGRLDARRRPLAHAACCGLYLGGVPAPDAEALMRSRYCAFVAEDGPYLLASWQARHRPATIDFDPGVKWLGLAVKSHRTTGPAEAEVEFVARQRDAAGRATRLHERSRFVHEDGRWLYVDGDQLPG